MAKALVCRRAVPENTCGENVFRACFNYVAGRAPNLYDAANRRQR